MQSTSDITMALESDILAGLYPPYSPCSWPVAYLCHDDIIPCHGVEMHITRMISYLADIV